LKRQDICLHKPVNLTFKMEEIQIKNAEEIEAQRHAGVILTEALNQLEAAVRPGMTTLDLDRLAEDFIRSHEGATPGFKGYHGFTGTICASINDEVVHGIPSSERVIKDGDIIGIDCGVKYKGLHTDACRTVCVGKVDPKIDRFVKATQKSLQMCLEMVKPGGRIGDISAEIQRVLEESGYAPVVECCGHGVGYDLHEAPEILNMGNKGEGPVMKTGMVLAIEPIALIEAGEIYTARDHWTILSRNHSLSAHFENTVLVTDIGHEVIAY